jgi:peroxiredoxin Q/BCP
VSADDQATSDRFRAALELPYALVGDPGKKILNAFGVRIPVLGLARRVTFVIGTDRRIEGVHESAFDPESHVAAACQVLLRKPGA